MYVLKIIAMHQNREHFYLAGQYFWLRSELALAGDESYVWNTLLEDFLIVVRKLEALGFRYCNGGFVIYENLVEPAHA